MTLLFGRRRLPKVRGLSWRYWVRVSVVPPLAVALRRMGVRWDRLGEVLGREVLIAQAPELIRSPAPDPLRRPLRIVFLTMMGGNSRLSAVESVLAQALRGRGHSVKMVLCDQQLPLCEVKAAGSEGLWKQRCAKCYAFGKASFEAGELNVVPVSELLQGRSIDSDESWESQVEGALLKHYRVGRAPKTPEAEERRRLLRVAARRSAAVARAVIEAGVDRVVMSHGNYATWGPARDVFNENSVPVLVYGDATKKDSIRLHWRSDSFWQEIADEYEAKKHVPLAADQSVRLDAYLVSRRRHTRDSHAYNLSEPSSPEALCRSLGLRSDAPVYVVFANLMWDAASSQRALMYSDPIEWIFSTMDWFTANPDLQLVVRPHPAEVMFGTNESVAAVVASERPSLPPNVKVLQPDAPINSWSLVQLATCGIVHTSTVGLELALEGKPCVVVSDTHYRGKGFTYDVDSQENYFDTLRRLSKADANPEAKELARRYAYILFERYQLPFPQLYSPQPRLPVAYRNAVQAPEGETTINLICDSIENLTAPLLPDNASGNVASADPENRNIRLSDRQR